MVVFFHNRHAEPLQGLIRRLQTEPDLTQAEAEALVVLAREIERETTTAPYRIWLRNQKGASSNLVFASGAPDPLPLDSSDRRYIAKP